MSQGQYRAHLKNHSNKKKDSHGAKAKFMDDLMYVVALIAPVMTIPQLLQVWSHKQSQGGVSILTWGAYASVSGLWLVYGIVHKEKPIMLTQFLLLILDSLIVIGVLFYK
jgi:MtN3 and saliva related transmembrane protein